MSEVTMKYRYQPTAEGPVKAYENKDFIHSPEARTVRVLCEFLEPGARFEALNIKDTVVFFGSARVVPTAEATLLLKKAEEEKAADPDSPLCEGKRLAAVRAVELSRYYEDAADLAARITRWSKELKDPEHRFIVCSGGGPGIMEAANRGASREHGATIGLNISLPHEQYANPYISREMTFEFHYFFMRKFWFVYLAKALIVFPGGFGTMDELFELLTLVQTGKHKNRLPIVLFGASYWREILNFDALVKWGMVSPQDLSLFKLCETVDEAFEYLRGVLTQHYLVKPNGEDENS